jgi:hypothetical protein
MTHQGEVMAEKLPHTAYGAGVDSILVIKLNEVARFVFCMAGFCSGES